MTGIFCDALTPVISHQQLMGVLAPEVINATESVTPWLYAVPDPSEMPVFVHPEWGVLVATLAFRLN